MYLVPGGVLSSKRGVLSPGGSGPRGVSGPGGVSDPRGVSGLGGCLIPGGVYLVRYSPPVDRQTPVNLLPCPKLRLRAVTRLDQLDKSSGA